MRIRSNKKPSPREGLELAVTAGANCGCAQRVSRIFKLDAAPDAAMLWLSFRETQRHHCPASVTNQELRFRLHHPMMAGLFAGLPTK